MRLVSVFGVACLLFIQGVVGTEAASPRPAGVAPRKPSYVPLPVVKDERVLRTVKSGDYRVVLDETRSIISLGMDRESSFRSEGEYRVGDTVKLKRASSIQAEGQPPHPVAQGEIFGVRTAIHDKWVGVSTIEDGRIHVGWLPVADVEFLMEESRVYPRIQPLIQHDFVAASVLIQKAKIFDDGLMATAQLAAQQGAGTLRGKWEWIPKLIRVALDTNSSAGPPLLASAQLGKLPVQIPGDQAAAVDALIRKFLGDELRSKPIGFYTWSPELTAVFQQDRMLQSTVNTKAIEPFVSALRNDAQSRAGYEAYVALVARLTNPPVGSDLRTLLAGQNASLEIPLISASVAPETNLIREMYGDRSIPEGFDLSAELVTRIREGRLSLKPQANAGWYAHQLWSLEPLITPERTPEAAKWSANEEYLKHLESVFKGAWALARETHIKDLDLPPAAAAPLGEEELKIDIHVQPQLTTEPLATSYRRRANSYRFVRSVLIEALGEATLTTMRRQTANGPIDRPLSEELAEIETLFDGAASLVERELGMRPAGANEESRTVQAQAFLDWAANIDTDVDIASDVRMMVPAFYDLERKQTKVWVFLGWTSRSMGYSYQHDPKVTVFDAKGKEIPASRIELSIHGNAATVVTPVFREMYVTKLLNRTEFRQLCDTYVTPRAIVEHLK